MSDELTPLVFPDLPDEAVIALHDFLETFTVCFQNHYFTQLRRAYDSPPPPACDHDQQSLPFDDPPF